MSLSHATVKIFSYRRRACKVDFTGRASHSSHESEEDYEDHEEDRSPPITKTGNSTNL